MKSMNDINKFLNTHTHSAIMDFRREINTDENKDYRRGFLAGVLFSFLQMKSHIGNIDDETAELEK